MTDDLSLFFGYAPQIELSAEKRTITGTITVFGSPTTDYRRIVLHEGALQPRLPLSRVKMLIDHDQRQPVGFMATLSDDQRTASFKIPEGEAGDKALADAAAHLRDGLSVGIQVLREDGASMYDAESGTYHVYKAELVEVSLCAIPAFQDAQVTSVAASHTQAPSTTTPKENTQMDQLTKEDLDVALAAQNDAHAEQFRLMEVALANAGTAQTVDTSQQFASYGHYLQALSSGDADAAGLFGLEWAVDGGTMADQGGTTRNAWLAEALRLVETRQKLIQTFSRKALPEKGLTLEYPVVVSDGTQVTEQAAEGDDLAFGKVVLGTRTAPVKTYGGYTSLSQKVIDRADIDYLNVSLQAMLLQYAKTSELSVRTALKALITAQIAANNKIALPAAPDAFDFLDLIVDASEVFEDRNFNLEGGLVSKDVFKQMIRLEDSAGNSLMRVQGEGVNQIGTIDARGLRGSLASLEFRIFPGANAKTLTFYDSIAYTTWQNGGPTRLQDGNVVNLTEDYSVYGYLAQGSQFPLGLLPVEMAV